MERNLTTGSVLRNILLFSLPYLLSYFLQTLYGMADLFIIGQFEGVASTTAVSVGSQVMHMITVMLVGLAMGSTVTIAQAVGGEKRQRAVGVFLSAQHHLPLPGPAPRRLPDLPLVPGVPSPHGPGHGGRVVGVCSHLPHRLPDHHPEGPQGSRRSLTLLLKNSKNNSDAVRFITHTVGIIFFVCGCVWRRWAASRSAAGGGSPSRPPV